MMKTLLQSVWLTALLIVTSTSALAGAVLQVDGGVLKGAKGVDIGGTLYDVEFVDTTCAAAFSGCDQSSDFLFQSQAEATAAANALLNQVVIDGPAGNFDSSPELTLGCSNSSYCWLVNAYWSGSVANMDALNGGTSISDGVNGPYVDLDAGARTDLTFARWTLAEAGTVPEPGTLSLLAGAALAFVGARRRAR